MEKKEKNFFSNLFCGKTKQNKAKNMTRSLITFSYSMLCYVMLLNTVKYNKPIIYTILIT